MSKIVDVKFSLRKYEYEKPFHITGSISSETKNVEVEIVLQSGIRGCGEASPSFRVNGEKVEAILSLENFVKEMLIGQEVENYGTIFSVTDKLFAFPSLKAAVQFAVLDALAQEWNTEVCNILGGMKEEIETDKTVGIDTIENRMKEAQRIYEEGFRVIKVKVGENLKEDIEAMMEIARVTKGARYIVDANMGYSPKEALEFAKKIYQAGVDVAVFEQPVRREDIEGLRFVRYHSPFPVAADESARTKFDVMRLVKEEAVDYVNIKLMKSGISDALAIVKIAESTGLKLMIGCMGESSLGINQSVHFALGTGAFEFHDLDSHLMLKEEKFRGKFLQEGPKMKVIHE
ncbi:L-Ala-D/L-Glu epimerase [Thermotoga sp. KOL6]|uniref:L-Ala-D/L-Glu epimerase n=1 Tax=Thermotoga sp. KOL6 TaxID=126741 RepID=UPI000C762A40|nr:L-Ala-D/L-Glu epimerase [Thermotoga sp. KOL6]PLV58060.1 dipeptide epimerase [Thermotoga sp. KOL6]